MIDPRHLQHSLQNSAQSGKGIKTAGHDGREIELIADGTHINWRYVGFSKWNKLIAIRDLTGADGPKGPKGEQGDKGNQGIQGTQGVKGDVGPRGLPGAKGNRGTDGYDGKNGTDGREIELRKHLNHIQWRYAGELLWQNLISLDELIGKTGKAGPQGEKGERGERGITGSGGSQGARGPQGYTGPAGPQGVPGDGANLFIQETAPITTEPVYQWWQTDGSGNLVTLWVETNGA